MAAQRMTRVEDQPVRVGARSARKRATGHASSGGSRRGPLGKPPSAGAARKRRAPADHLAVYATPPAGSTSISRTVRRAPSISRTLNSPGSATPSRINPSVATMASSSVAWRDPGSAPIAVWTMNTSPADLRGSLDPNHLDQCREKRPRQCPDIDMPEPLALGQRDPGQGLVSQLDPSGERDTASARAELLGLLQPVGDAHAGELGDGTQPRLGPRPVRLDVLDARTAGPKQPVEREAPGSDRGGDRRVVVVLGHRQGHKGMVSAPEGQE